LRIQELIGGILRAFVLLETYIADYWSQIPAWFPIPEIAEAARMISAEEVRHGRAYSLLEESLGLRNYTALLQDEVARQKLDHFILNPDTLVSLAVFSGFGEGVSLYGSFAILKSFCRGIFGGKFTGIGQIISYSAQEERVHSDFGCWLFRQMRKEVGITPSQIEQIEQGFVVGLNNEFDFLESVFKDRNVPQIHIDQLFAFLCKLATERMNQLGLDPKVIQDNFGGQSFESISDWFFPSIEGLVNHDFFANFSEGSNYSTHPTQNWEKKTYANIRQNLEILI